MLLQVTPIVVTAPVMTLGTTMTHQFTSTAAPYPGGGHGVAASGNQKCRAFSVASCPPDSPGCTRFVPPAASCRTDVGSQPWPQHHVGRHGGGRPSVFSMPERGWTPYAWAQVARRP